MPAPVLACHGHAGVQVTTHALVPSTVSRRTGLVVCHASRPAIIAATAVAAASNLMNDEVSMHPDAVRRRQQAEDRWEATGPENMIFAMSAEMFDDIVQHGKSAGQLVVVKFFAPWCQACKALYPKFVQIAEHNPDVTFVKVNAADETMLAMASALGVTKLPYFHMYTHGQLAKNFTANLHKVSYLRRAISDCKQCLTPGCHEPTEPTPFMSKSLE